MIVSSLNVRFKEREILKNISFKSKGNLAIIGKSGSGKSTLARALSALLPKNLSLSAQTLKVCDFNLLSPKNSGSKGAKSLQELRKRVAFVFQDAQASFYPLLDIGRIFDIALKTHTKLNKKARKELAFSYFERLNLVQKDLIWHSYIWQLSGGMAMRVQLALALACGAQLLILDEPTSSLDSKNAQALSRLLKSLDKRLIIISHDLDFVKDLCDELLLLDGGEVAEFALSNEFFKAPKSVLGKEFLDIYKNKILNFNANKEALNVEISGVKALLKVENLSKFYEIRKHFYLKKTKHFIFENLNFSLNLKQNLLISGQSGSGKSTIARCLAGLEAQSAGKIYLDEKEISKAIFSAQRLARKDIQYIFQEQKLALNPYKRVKNLLFEVYENFKIKPDLARLEELLALFEFKKDLLELKPLQLSGGEAARLGLLRALILEPKLLILDEITASLDLKTSAKILSYLQILQSKRAISYIFISHKPELLNAFKPKILSMDR